MISPVLATFERKKDASSSEDPAVAQGCPPAVTVGPDGVPVRTGPYGAPADATLESEALGAPAPEAPKPVVPVPKPAVPVPKPAASSPSGTDSEAQWFVTVEGRTFHRYLMCKGVEYARTRELQSQSAIANE